MKRLTVIKSKITFNTMKKISGVFGLLLFFGCSGIRSDQILHSDDLHYKIIQVGTEYVDPSNGNLIAGDVASSFVVKYSGKYFLVSNYHVFAGRDNFDTTYLRNNYPPNVVVVSFYKKNGGIVRTDYLLLDENERKFLSLPPKPGSKSVLNIAILQLDTIPKNAIIDPIDLETINMNWKINSSDSLSIYGFRGNAGFEGKFPTIDTIFSIQDSIFNQNSELIFAKRTIDIGGDSGGLIFDNKGNLVAMVSKETKDATPFLLWPELKNFKNHDLVYEFISIGTVKSVFNELFGSPTK